ncbi:hypothetical protein [Streptomyces aureocirculatus]|uniref:hypothetical protein n=1 Tax=Streptomyces aureocirculatus TaxID=67275 RepID=UPI0004C622E6|nr:hypothetical protein [Streptomyces aureocirculatus]
MRNDIGARLARLEKLVQSIIRSPKLVNASLEDGALDVYDENGSLRAVLGRQPDGTSGLTAVNGPRPPIPSPAQVEPVLGGVRVTWDGTFTDSEPAPLDLSRVQVHVLDSADDEPDVQWPTTTIEAASGASVTVAVNHYGPVWVRLTAVSTSGTPSGASQAVEVSARRAVSDDLGNFVVQRENVALGAITADLLAADAINGKVITGATVQTAEDGPRVVLNSARLRAIGTNGSAIGMEPNAVYPYIYWESVDGSNQAYINVSGSNAADANIGINSGTFTDPDDNDTYRWRTFFGNDFYAAERITAKGNRPVGGRLYLGKSSAQLGAGPEGGSLSLARGAASLFATSIRAAGVLRADNVALGTATITPVANKPTSITLTGGNVKGTKFRAFVTPNTSAPGEKVVGVGVTGVSSSGLTIWVHRTNTTPTLVHWMIIGED